jgi:phosphoribosylformylglycinamidine synthase
MSPPPIHRIEVTAAPGHADPKADALRRDASALGMTLTSARTSQVYLIEAALSAAQVRTVGEQLLADPVTEQFRLGASPATPNAQLVEVHPLPGVMDPVAQSVQTAIRELVGVEARVSTGWRYDLAGIDGAHADTLASRLLANPVIQRIHRAPYSPEAFPSVKPHAHEVQSIPLIKLSDAELTKLSREAHLFLSLDEMKALQEHYRSLGREPRDIELETLAQTWSEHCVHKTLKSTVVYKGAHPNDPIRWEGRPGHVVSPDGSVTIHNILKSTVAAATHELIKEGVDWTLSVFVDNAGVIAFDERHAVCVKVETHNHPSAIEPYGGAATGIGGCIRDVIGTGLGARPIASTDVFCVASPTLAESSLPPGCLHPRRVLTQVVAGVRDYGNRMGIPTVSGAVYFDDRYIGNPLVYCGCIGVMPRDRIKGEVKSGDLIVALGGRTGRDGIHGATFSSAELEQSSADEFAHAVQIGNAIEEKRVLDAIMRARDAQGGPLFNGLTDCGAGGFSSAVGEMGKSTGATVHLERAPLKYDGLSYTEIWISEAQERMVLAVPARNLEALRRICAEESVELAVLGTFGPEHGAPPASPELALFFHGKEVGRMAMHFLHDGIPTPHREAAWNPGVETPRPAPTTRTPAPSPLLALLAHPNIASKHWIIRQYDHEVRGATTLKPLVGPGRRGPGDASVVQPVQGSKKGLAISQGLQTGVGDPAIGGDPYLMALAAIDECVRNLVCVGADPARTAILDNFCWPSCAKPQNLASLVRAAEGCYDAAKAYRTPFVSGKDSLNNQFTIPASGGAAARTIEIPPTLLITGISVVDDASRCVSMDAKGPAVAGEPTVLLHVGVATPLMGGSHYRALTGSGGDAGVPRTDLRAGPATANAVAALIRDGLVLSAHDVSDGGLLCAVAEMLLATSEGASGVGASIDLAGVHADPVVAAYSESPSRYVLEVRQRDAARVQKALGATPSAVLGATDTSGTLRVGAEQFRVADLLKAWRGTLDW